MLLTRMLACYPDATRMLLLATLGPAGHSVGQTFLGSVAPAHFGNGWGPSTGFGHRKQGLRALHRGTAKVAVKLLKLARARSGFIGQSELSELSELTRVLCGGVYRSVCGCHHSSQNQGVDSSPML